MTATRHVADHFLPGWVAAAGLDTVRLDFTEGDTLTVAQTVRAGEAAVGFTEGPGAPLGLRSEVVASEEVVPVVGPPHRWFGRRRPVTGHATWRRPRSSSVAAGRARSTWSRPRSPPTGRRPAASGWR